MGDLFFFERKTNYRFSVFFSASCSIGIGDIFLSHDFIPLIWVTGILTVITSLGMNLFERKKAFSPLGRGSTNNTYRVLYCYNEASLNDVQKSPYAYEDFFPACREELLLDDFPKEHLGWCRSVIPFYDGRFYIHFLNNSRIEFSIGGPDS